MLRYLIFIFGILGVCLMSFGQNNSAFAAANNTIDNLTAHVQRAQTIYNNVKNNATFQDILNGKDVELPVKILPSNKDERYALYLDSLNFTPEYAYATIYFVLDISSDEMDEKLIFVGDDIRFTRKGGFTGDAKLYLAENVDINFGENATVTFLAEDNYPTHLIFTCDGFKEISLSANIAFSSDFAVPVDANNQPIPNGRLESRFNVTLSDWEDWVAQVEIQKFQLTKCQDFTFDFGLIAYDHSDTRNANSFPGLPSFYDVNALYGGDETLWRGLYIERAELTLPRMFYKKSQPRDPMAINGYEMYIDKQGFSGQVEVLNLIPMGEGEMSSWDYSVERIALEFQTGTLTNAELLGGVILPISSEEHELGYQAIISYDNVTKKTNYLFSADLQSDIDFNVFNVADVEIFSGSRLDVAVVQKKFKPSALLNAKITLTPQLGGVNPSGIGLRVEKMKLSTDKPYVSFEQGGGASLEGEASLKGFPIEITRVGIVSHPTIADRLGLDIGVEINFMDSKDGTGLSGGAGLIVWGDRSNTVLRYEYARTQLTDVIIEFETTALYIYGQATFYQGDELMGDGLDAQLQARVADKINVEARGIFGKANEGYRYWLVEMGVSFKPAIPFFPGVGLNAFTGGAYHHMGYDVSKNDYIPNSEIALGLKAGIGVQSIPSDKAFGGLVQLELAFDQQFRFNFLRFKGEVQFVRTNSAPTDLGIINRVANDPSQSSEAGAAAIVGWDITYNVPLKTLFGTVDTYIAVPPQSPIVSGANTGGKYPYKAGTVSIYFSDRDWYVYVGKPVNEPIALNLKIGSFRVGTVQTYFVMGTQLPSPPMAPVPAVVRNLVGEKNVFDPTMLKSGAGVGLGFRFDIGIDARSPRILGVAGYVNASFGAGFDVLFMKTDKMEGCAWSGERGINNWYGYGQIYIYACAKIGADIDIDMFLFSIKTQVDVLGLDLAAYMFLQGPRPTFAQGSVAAKASLLGGMVNADFKFNVKFGDNGCMNSTKEDETKIFAYTMPMNESESVDPYVNPTTYFNIPMGKTFKVADNSGKMIDVKVELVASSIKLMCVDCSPANTVVDINYTIGREAVVIKPKDVLLGEKTYRIQLTGRFLQANGSVYGAIAPQSYQAIFKTKKESMQIPLSNIAYSYPLPNMENFYKDESNEGYVSLITKPNIPFQKMTGYTYQVHYLQGSRVVFSSNNVTVTNQRGGDHFKFPIPSGQLQEGQNYILKIVQTKDDKSTGSTSNSGTVQYGTTNDLSAASDSVILNYTFKTSEFRTFADKIASISNSQTTIEASGRIVHQLSGLGSSSEGFSGSELAGFSPNGVDRTQPLIKVVYKTIDQNFKTAASNSVYRNASLFAQRYEDYDYDYPPFEAYKLAQNNGLTVNLDVMYAMQTDHDFAKSKYGSVVYSTTSGFPTLNAGSHGYFLTYRLPGRAQPNSSVSMNIALNQPITIK